MNFFGDDKLVSTMRGSGAEIKTIIYCLQSGKEKEIPVLARYIRGLGDDYYYYNSNDKKTVVLNKNGDIVKIFNNEYKSIIKPNNDIYNKTYFLTRDFDEKVNVILNEKFDEIATVDDDFAALMYDECYSYVSGGVFYVRDYDNFIIYKENIDKFGYGRPSYNFFDLDANE